MKKNTLQNFHFLLSSFQVKSHYIIALSLTSVLEITQATPYLGNSIRLIRL